MADIKVLMFDLGGVLLRLNSQGEIFDFQMDESEFLSRWIRSPAVREFERGAIDAETFARAIVDEADLPYAGHEFLRRFAAWPDQLYPGITAMLDGIPTQYRRVLLSNTNAIHWHRKGISDELVSRFDGVFLSYLTGRLKPDTDAYQMVLDEMQCRAHQVVFFDDNPANIASANELGIQSFLTRGAGELRETLGRLKISA